VEKVARKFGQLLYLPKENSRPKGRKFAQSGHPESNESGFKNNLELQAGRPDEFVKKM
jgi:hypothetical protein